MTKNSGCSCFLCRNADDKEALKSYLTGRFEMAERLKKILEESGIIYGSLCDKDPIRKIYAEVSYEKECSGVFLAELEECKR